MPRLSIEISNDEHRKLKAIAALAGQSIKDYVLDCSLPQQSDLSSADLKDSMKTLSEFLEKRLENVAKGNFVENSAEDIRKIAKKRAGLWTEHG